MENDSRQIFESKYFSFGLNPKGSSIIMNSKNTVHIQVNYTDLISTFASNITSSNPMQSAQLKQIIFSNSKVLHKFTAATNKY